MHIELPDDVFYKFRAIEVEIRGRYLRFSANIEGHIVRNIILLNEELFLKSNIEIPLNFKDLMFHKKIEKYKSLLIELHFDLFKKHEKLFEILFEFKEVRNKIAHNLITHPNTDLNKLTICELNQNQDKIWYYEPVEYSVEKLINTLDIFMRKIIEDFNALTSAIIEIVKPKMPELFSSLDV